MECSEVLDGPAPLALKPKASMRFSICGLATYWTRQMMDRDDSMTLVRRHPLAPGLVVDNRGIAPRISKQLNLGLITSESGRNSTRPERVRTTRMTQNMGWLRAPISSLQVSKFRHLRHILFTGILALHGSYHNLHLLQEGRFSAELCHSSMMSNCSVDLHATMLPRSNFGSLSILSQS